MNPLHEFFLRIGNITLRITAGDPDLKLYADGAKEKFLVHHGNPDIDISVGWRHLVHEPVGRELFDSGSIWKLYRQGEFKVNYSSLLNTTAGTSFLVRKNGTNECIGTWTARRLPAGAPVDYSVAEVHGGDGILY